MRALVLCAGFGTRLGMLTKSLPKPLLRVGQKPLVEHIIRNIASIGIMKVSINLHYMPDAIPAYFRWRGELGVELDFCREERLLGTAGSARKLYMDGKIQGSLLVNYGDVITDMNLETLISHHLSTKAWVTILVHRRTGSNSAVYVDENGWVERFEERPQVAPTRSAWVFSGICVLSPQCLESIPDRVPCDLPKHVFQKLAGSGKINSVALEGYRCAIDSPARLRSAERAWRCGAYRPMWRKEMAA